MEDQSSSDDETEKDEEEEDAASDVTASVDCHDTELWKRLPRVEEEEEGAADGYGLFLITVFGTRMKQNEPCVDKLPKGVRVAGQQENPTASTLETHWHFAISVPISMARRKGVSLEVLEGLFPKSKLQKKDVRVGVKGTRFDTIAGYATKSWARVRHTQPLLVGWSPPVPGTQVKRTAAEMDTLVTSAPSIYRLRELGETRGKMRRDYCMTMELHGERVPIYPALSEGQEWLAWERVVFDMLRRPPHPKRDAVHWLYPKSGDMFPEFDRFAVELRRVLNKQKRSRELAFVHSESPPAAITTSLRHETKVVVVDQCEQMPLSHGELHKLGYRRQLHFWAKGCHSWVELQPRRHVLVLSTVPPTMGRGSGSVREWPVGSSKEEGKYEFAQAMLDSVGELEDYDFLDLKLAGVSGSTVKEVETAALCDPG
jgi:hypothetical protein